MSHGSPGMVLPVVVYARHARVSAVHAEILFGARSLTEICALPHGELWAAAETVVVKGGTGALQGVRVLGPVALQTEVRLSARDASHIAGGVDASVTLHGPLGSVVLSAAARPGLRAIFLTAADAERAALREGSVALVRVRGERERDLKDVVVHVLTGSGHSASHVRVDVDDANALEVGPSTRASVVVG